MKTNPLKKAGISTAAGSGTVTQKMVVERAGALAVIKGRYASDVTEFDLAQARRELTDEAAAKA